MRRSLWICFLFQFGCDSLLGTHKTISNARCEFVAQVPGSTQSSSHNDYSDNTPDSTCQSWCEEELKTLCKGKADQDASWRCRFRGEILRETKSQCPS